MSAVIAEKRELAHRTWAFLGDAAADKSLSASAFRLLFVVCRASFDGTKLVEASAAKLANMAGRSRRRVFADLDELERSGLIVRISRARERKASQIAIAWERLRQREAVESAPDGADRGEVGRRTDARGRFVAVVRRVMTSEVAVLAGSLVGRASGGAERRSRSAFDDPGAAERAAYARLREHCFRQVGASPDELLDGVGLGADELEAAIRAEVRSEGSGAVEVFRAVAERRPMVFLAAAE